MLVAARSGAEHHASGLRHVGGAQRREERGGRWREAIRKGDVGDVAADRASEKMR
jgi:hypothetical protein